MTTRCRCTLPGMLKSTENGHRSTETEWPRSRHAVGIPPRSESCGDIDRKSRVSPSPYEGLQIASQLLMADGGRTVSKPFRSFEGNDAGMIPALRALRLPRFIMKIYVCYLRYFRRDSIYAGLVESFREKTVAEYYALIAQREDYRARWFKVWRGTQVEGSLGDDGVDFILTVPNALPAVPHRGMRHGWKACGYTFIFNLVRDELISRCKWNSEPSRHQA